MLGLSEEMSVPKVNAPGRWVQTSPVVKSCGFCTPPSDKTMMCLQVLLVYKGKGICGGVIYKPTWILTASHCMKDIDIQFLKVVAGIHFIFWTTDTRYSPSFCCGQKFSKSITLSKKLHNSPFSSFTVCQESTTRKWMRAQNRLSRSLGSSCTRTTCRAQLTMTLPFSS